MALGDLLAYTVKQKPQNAVWTVHLAWGQNCKYFLQLLFYCMKTKQLLILAKPITSAEFLFCPTRVGKVHGNLRWAHSKYKIWVVSCSDCKENVCVWGGKLFVFNQSFFRYRHCVELFQYQRAHIFFLWVGNFSQCTFLSMCATFCCRSCFKFLLGKIIADTWFKVLSWGWR